MVAEPVRHLRRYVDTTREADDPVRLLVDGLDDDADPAVVAAIAEAVARAMLPGVRYRTQLQGGSRAESPAASRETVRVREQPRGQ